MLTGHTRMSMIRVWQWLVLACFLVAPGAQGAEHLAKGRLLVAAREIQGPIFAESVILLLNYQAETGAVGIIVNHPTDVQPAEVLPPSEGLARYRGAVYLGGPVEMHVLIALLRADRPPETALNVFGDVHLVPPEKALAAGSAADASRLRLYVGYAGWAPGQLENEIARGDWSIRAATEDVVFAKEPGNVWRKLVPARAYQAATDSR